MQNLDTQALLDANTRLARLLLRNPSAMLDELAHGLASHESDEVARSLQDLVLSLGIARRILSPADWTQFAQRVQQHPLTLMLQEDPLTHRAHAKLRGYAGDAATLDTIYGLGCLHEDLGRATLRGRRIHRATRASPTCQAVRNRRYILGQALTEAMLRHASPRVLVLASGHLREAELVPWAAMDHLDLFLATDQDPASLGVIAERADHPRLEARELSVRSMLKGELAEGDFDLAYAAGLYDYLDQRVATALTHAMVAKLRPGGAVIVANFVPETHERGYMEAVMDWHLIYRDEAQLQALAPEGCSVRTWREDSAQVAFVEIRKPA